MTGLAQQGCTTAEHCRVDGTVRLMTVSAVLAHGRMVKQDRAAELGVTLETNFIGRVATQQPGGDRRVGIVTIRAHHRVDPHRRIGPERVRERLHAVRLLLGMAIEADGVLSGVSTHRVDWVVNIVATDATHIALGMLAGNPAGRDVAIVATGADRILVRHRGRRVETKGDDAGVLGADAAPARMIAAGSVTAFTLQ